MKLAFALFTYFPHGGLTKDLIAITRQCQQRGHQVNVFAGECRAELASDIDLHILPVKGMSNHARNYHFAEQLQASMSAYQPDLLVGFNKMPGLDVYYAADSCFAEKAARRNIFYRLTPRCRHFLAFEKAVFGLQTNTRILMIAENQISVYQHFYATPDYRMQLLPPGISRDRVADADAQERRRQFRQQWQLGEQDRLVLMVGSGFRTKGLDRAITALAALPAELLQRTRLFVVGNDKSATFEKLATQLQLQSKVHFLGGRDDVPEFLLGADLLIHPAYRENTGTVLLEAMVAGLPVLTSDVCGYARYVREEQMGEVIDTPFSQTNLNKALHYLLMKEDRNVWRQRGKAFAARADIYDLPLHACDAIEELAASILSDPQGQRQQL